MMTGRRLYDKYCDAARANTKTMYDGDQGEWVAVQDVLAWPFLIQRERNMWNELARAITPRKAKA